MEMTETQQEFVYLIDAMMNFESLQSGTEPTQEEINEITPKWETLEKKFGRTVLVGEVLIWRENLIERQRR